MFRPYRASLRIAKAGKPHTIGEELCLPLAKEMTGIMCGEKAAKQLSLVPLFNDTVSRRIQAMANNVKLILVERIKCSPILMPYICWVGLCFDADQLLVLSRCKFLNTIHEFTYT